MAVVISRIEPRQNLTTELAGMLRRQIQSGELKPGDKLPTEQQLLKSASVSRTVVREAVAVLKAEGLLIARQGVGVFVSAQIGDQMFRIDTGSLDSLPDLIKVLELRLCVEAEAAALAAGRRTGDQLEELEGAFAAFTREVKSGGPATGEDIAFHAVIAVSSGNEHFANFIRYLGSRLFVPGKRILTLLERRNGNSERMRGILQEHEAILTAIRAGSPDNARKAMRNHLESSLARHRTAAGA